MLGPIGRELLMWWKMVVMGGRVSTGEPEAEGASDFKRKQDDNHPETAHTPWQRKCECRRRRRKETNSHQESEDKVFVTELRDPSQPLIPHPSSKYFIRFNLVLSSKFRGYGCIKIICKKRQIWYSMYFTEKQESIDARKWQMSLDLPGNISTILITDFFHLLTNLTEVTNSSSYQNVMY